MNLRNVNRVLQGRGILAQGNDGRAAQVATLPGTGSTRTYVVNNAALFAEAA
ncbi:hypothetical protein D3C81_2234960 [compost metagenome]